MIKNITTFILTLAGLIILFLASALIPQDAIRENTIKSSLEYKMVKPQEFNSGNKFNSLSDNYADVIELGVMWNMTDENPIKAILDSRYYDGNTEKRDYGENYGFYASVNKGVEPNTDYTRYWHGDVIYLRALHVFTNIVNIRIILMSVCMALLACLCWVLYRKERRAIAMMTLAALACVQIWNIRLAVEYIPAVLVGLITAIYCVKNHEKVMTDMKIWIVSGVLIAFFDILTCELLTIALPLAIVYVMRQQDKKIRETKQEIIQMAKIFTAWGASYLATFLSKWTLASLVLGENKFTAAISAAGVRINGETDSDYTPMEVFFRAPAANISTMMGGEETIAWKGVFIFLIITAIAVSLIYILKRKEDKTFLAIMSLLAAMPIVRFFVLSNHSYLHEYFTYRALAVTVFALISMIYVVTSKEKGSKAAVKAQNKNRKR
ncbi:MAG: hypothetical protein MJZ31_08595 [Bacteroidales bacterium]|nr:hypothetical protein [Bacteroidales bacterium]